jgi:hypothetical protein
MFHFWKCRLSFVPVPSVVSEMHVTHEIICELAVRDCRRAYVKLSDSAKYCTKKGMGYVGTIRTILKFEP